MVKKAWAVSAVKVGRVGWNKIDMMTREIKLLAKWATV
jgi:hypothetical protein